MKSFLAHSSIKTLSLMSAGLSLLVSAEAFADRGHHHYRYEDDSYRRYAETEYGDVIEARPIYREVAFDVPREHCRVETVATEERHHRDNVGGTVIGGLIGAAVGHELGNGRGAATAAGGLIGAAIGNSSGDTTRTRYRNQEVCRKSYQTGYEQRIIGYDVRYSFHGRIYSTRTDRHPGDRIPLSVSVNPRDY